MNVTKQNRKIHQSWWMERLFSSFFGGGIFVAYLNIFILRLTIDMIGLKLDYEKILGAQNYLMIRVKVGRDSFFFVTIL